MTFDDNKHFFVDITTSKARGVLYVGMTSDLPGRAIEHLDRMIDGFTKRYWAGRLVYFESHDTGEQAAKREKQLKRWHRAWKIELIEAGNPTWRDLFNEVLVEFGYEP